MSDTREHLAFLTVGRKATGKSTLLNNDVVAYLAANPNKKVLIIDVNGSPAYNQHPRLMPNEVHRFKQPGQIARLEGTPTLDTLAKIAANFRNGFIIFEDCTKYISGHPDPIIKTFLVDHRMYGCDLSFTFHSLIMVPPFFWQMISYVRLLKTNEVFKKSYYTRIPNCAEVEAAFKQVAANKDNYYHKTVATAV